jgi:hypothetical protein
MFTVSNHDRLGSFCRAKRGIIYPFLGSEQVAKKSEVTEVPQDDIWRTIPPEEKLLLMSRAQGTGCIAVLISCLIAAPIAIALQVPWIFWGALLASPFIFQFAAGRAWRDLRPRVMLEYLAARSAARRYAFANKSKELKLELLFRGKLERIFGLEDQMQALEAAVEDTKEAQVWVALFTDAVVLMSEGPGGAHLEFAHPINDRLQMKSDNEGGGSGYQTLRAVELIAPGKKPGTGSNLKITSPYPAALVVFERKLNTYVKAAHIAGEERAKLLESAPVGDTDI